MYLFETPCFWRRFIDDTFTIIKVAYKRSFLDHINSVDEHIQFTSEDSRPDGSMPFLDILIRPNEDGSLSTPVYRKTTHRDLYLQWDSHHTVSSKYSVIGTLHHRSETICSSSQLLQQEEKYLQKALQRCKYPAWALNRVDIKSKSSANKKRRDTTKTGHNSNNNNNNNNNNNQEPYMVVPYYRALSESLKNVCIRHGVQVYFKGGNTIKNLLVAPKDWDPIQEKSGVIYRYKCDRVDCDKEYIGESSRAIGERFKEHQKAPSPIFDHFNTTGHSITIDNFSIVGREDQYLNRAIKEALFIGVNNPFFNRNIGKFHLPHIWDEVLFNTSELKLNWTYPWLFNLPIGINIYHTHPFYSGYSICHLANNTYQTTVVTCNLCGFNIYHNIIRQ